MPVAVIVTEYVDIAKAFYEDDEPKLVNAVLDRVARRVRGEGRGKDAAVNAETGGRPGAAHGVILAMAQAIVGSAAPICLSVGGLVGAQLLGHDKSLATAAGHRVQCRRGARRIAGCGGDAQCRSAPRLHDRHGRHRNGRGGRHRSAVSGELLAVCARPPVGRRRRRLRPAVPLRRCRQCATAIQGQSHLLRARRRHRNRGSGAADRHLHPRAARSGDVCRLLRLDRRLGGGRRAHSVVPADCSASGA